jgi:hypothetical protein
MGELQEMNRKLSKLTSKNKVILGFGNVKLFTKRMDREESKWGRDKTMFAPTFFGYNLEKEEECLP